MLALTPADFDLDKGLLSITKSYQRLKAMDAGETAELGGMGFHLVDEEEARATEDLVDEASGEEGVIRDYDGFAASEEDEELADDLANLADDDEGIEALDGIDDAAYQGFDDEDAAGANDGANDGVVSEKIIFSITTLILLYQRFKTMS